MIFEPGRDANGRTPLLADGKPAFAVCGSYYICRAYTPQGYKSDAWYKPKGCEIAEQLEGGVTARRAVQICVDHASGKTTA